MPDSGWYPDPSNEGFERYWDGTTWSTETRARAPQPSYQPPTGPPQQQQQPYGQGGYQPPQPYGQGGYQPPQPYGQPAYQQPAGAYQAYQPPGPTPYPGYLPYGTPSPTMMGAAYGKRVVAYLIDGVLSAGPLIVAYVLFFVAVAASSNSDSIGPLGVVALLLVLVAVLWAIGFTIWNLFVRQGKTGQSIGKQKQGIKLVREIDGQPVGGGMAFVRYFVAGIIGNLTCNIFNLVDYLWPLWDERKQRLIDKMFKFQVIEV